ncbi:MAG: hypothetical protein ACRDRV_01375 [Pseudonocardiaceae bacterium]
MTRPSDGGEVPASEFIAQTGGVRDLGDVPDVPDVGDIVDLVIRARACAEDLGLEHPRVGDLTGVLAFDLDIALDHAISLTRDLTVEDVLTLTCDLDRALTLDFDLDRLDQRRLVDDLELARRLTNELAVTLFSAAGTRTPATRAADVRAGRLPLGMVRIAVWVLPAAHQPRYNEEFRAELAAMDELPRRAQLGYALRQLARAWSLRRALASG